MNCQRMIALEKGVNDHDTYISFIQGPLEVGTYLGISIHDIHESCNPTTRGTLMVLDASHLPTYTPRKHIAVQPTIHQAL